ncbi:MAG: hypothetical protein KAS49_03940 [Candidatus Cloacimonetes bacterium]|nr:hypothetical protein [Candidatus Cloacimonadota bacterium]
MRFLLICLLMILSLSMFAISNYACISTLNNPSAADYGFGVEGGTANIWNVNPLSAWSNPAKLGYMDGFSYGFSIYQPFPDVTNLDDVYRKSSYMSYGWNGIGFMLPMVNFSGKFGTTQEWGKQDNVDEVGQIIGIFTPEETAMDFAFGANILEILHAFYNHPPRHLNYDISVGFNLTSIKSELVPEFCGASESLSDPTGNGMSTNIGILARYTPSKILNSSFTSGEFTAGLNLLNPFSSTIYYTDKDQADLLPTGNKLGLAGRINLDRKWLETVFQNADTSLLASFCDYVVSVTGTIDYADYKYWQTHSMGIEVTLLDILSYRLGHYSDEKGGLNGLTASIGLGFHYKNYFRCQFNLSGFVADGYANTPAIMDFGINLNLIKMLGFS